jgi:hypothetical protein
MVAGLAACKGEGATQRRAWRRAVYEVIQTMTSSMPQGQVAIERLCRVARDTIQRLVLANGRYRRGYRYITQQLPTRSAARWQRGIDASGPSRPLSPGRTGLKIGGSRDVDAGRRKPWSRCGIRIKVSERELASISSDVLTPSSALWVLRDLTGGPKFAH